MKKACILPRLVLFLISLVTIAGCFLPYISMTDEYRQYLDVIVDTKISDNIDITARDIKDISLFKYSKTYYQGRQEIFHDDASGIFYAVLFATPGFLGFLILCCSLRNRGIPVLLLSLLMGGIMYIINWDVLSRGIMPSSNAKWGISHTHYYPCAAILFVCGIWLIIAKRIAKKHCT